MAGRSAVLLLGMLVVVVVALQSAHGFNEERLPQKKFIFFDMAKHMFNGMKDVAKGMGHVAKGMATGMKDVAKGMATGMKDVATGMGKTGLTMMGGGVEGMTDVAKALADAFRGKCFLPFCKSSHATAGQSVKPAVVKPVVVPVQSTAVKPPPVEAKTSCQDKPGADCKTLIASLDNCKHSLSASYCAKTCNLC